MHKLSLLSLLAVGVMSSAARAEDWSQWLGDKRDGVWRETGVVDKLPEGGPVVKWRVPVGGGYAGPAVAKGRVFVTDRVAEPGRRARGEAQKGIERLHCLDAATGKPRWVRQWPAAYTISYAAGPRATPTVDGDRVYVLGAEGELLCLKVDDGGVVWQVNVNEGKTPIWGYAGHPLIDGDVLYTLCTGKNMVRAMDKHTGKTLWSALTAGKEGPGYCPPTMVGKGPNKQLIIWNPETLNSLDPRTGAVNWSEPFGPVQNGVSIATPVERGDKLMISSSWDGTLIMQLDPDKPAAKVFLKRGGKPGSKKTEALHSLMSNIILTDEHIYGVCARGELRCVDAKTGERLWETLAATTSGEPKNWATAFLIPNGDRFFITNELGDLIVAKLSPKGYEEISRAHLLEPVNKDANRPTLWSCPAYANKSMYWRNDKELICVSLSK